MHFHCSLRGSTACPQQSFVHRWITNGWMIWIDVNGISRFDLQSKILILSGLTVGALALWQRRRSRSISPETVETQDISPPALVPLCCHAWNTEVPSPHPLLAVKSYCYTLRERAPPFVSTCFAPLVSRFQSGICSRRRLRTRLIMQILKRWRTFALR